MLKIINMTCKLIAIHTSQHCFFAFLQEDEFRKKAQMFHCQFKNLKNVCTYFRNHWEPIGHLWSDFGRCYKHGDSDTNNLIER